MVAIITAGVITKEVLLGLVMDLSSEVMGKLQKYTVNESTVIHDLLRTTDIYTQINIVNALASDIEKNYFHLSGTALEIALISIHEIIDKIKIYLNELETALVEYNNEWISFYKNPQYMVIHDKLKESIQILDKRIKLLISCMSMYMYH